MERVEPAAASGLRANAHDALEASGLMPVRAHRAGALMAGLPPKIISVTVGLDEASSMPRTILPPAGRAWSVPSCVEMLPAGPAG